MMEGTGGKISGSITGNLAAGWQISASSAASGLTITVDKEIGADGFARQLIHIQGTPTIGGAAFYLSVRQCRGNSRR